MARIGYPGLGTHAVVHQQLLRHVSSRVDQFRSSG